MKDANDNHTADLLASEKKPAMTATQRKQAQWARDLEHIAAGNWGEVSKSGLLRVMSGGEDTFPAWAEYGRRSDYITGWQQFHGKEPVSNAKT
jgi:hypothetical protein